MTLTPHDVFDWAVTLAPILPALIHAAQLDQSRVGAFILRLLPDVVGAFKRQAPREKP